MLRLIPSVRSQSLFDFFVTNVCGRDLPNGNPDPALFLLVAVELGLSSAVCLVVEKASFGDPSDRAGGMAVLGIARLGDAGVLSEADADMVVDSFDKLARESLAEGQLGQSAP